MDKLRRALSGDDGDSNEQTGLAAQINNASTLSWSTRIQGFIFCFVLGFVFSILGTILMSIFIGPKGLTMFAIFYTLGNIMSMCSTVFLMGPWRQLKTMFKETRIIATCLVLFFIVLTLLSALVWEKRGLAIIFCICEFLAMTWYSLSYIPYARDAVKKTLTTCIA
ncbi:hypothetical protein B4U80_07514 [Leptotrombidium deliense]|uniref:Vesicle transport protein n=1 Tax=Leptotrombidium deliense TaxID=299467 RepID=A0A443S1P1_9ACAR|nr:hypothetical protein B4U80_07514 [Leptotrombidium deliense]